MSDGTLQASQRASGLPRGRDPWQMKVDLDRVDIALLARLDPRGNPLDEQCVCPVNCSKSMRRCQRFLCLLLVNRLPRLAPIKAEQKSSDRRSFINGRT